MISHIKRLSFDRSKKKKKNATLPATYLKEKGKIMKKMNLKERKLIRRKKNLEKWK